MNFRSLFFTVLVMSSLAVTEVVAMKHEEEEVLHSPKTVRQRHLKDPIKVEHSVFENRSFYRNSMRADCYDNLVCCLGVATVLGLMASMRYYFGG